MPEYDRELAMSRHDSRRDGEPLCSLWFVVVRCGLWLFVNHRCGGPGLLLLLLLLLLRLRLRLLLLPLPLRFV